MNAILFATNYSTASENAGDYAAQLARMFNTSLIVFHSWTLPVLTPEDAVLVPPPATFHERERKEVEKEVIRLRTRWGIPVTGVEVNGYAPDEISRMAKEKQISLVVLGMHHHNFCSRLLGSVATTSLHRAGYPVLLVPDTIHFTPPTKILMAADPAHAISDDTMNTLKLFVRKAGADLNMVHVETPGHLWNVEESSGMIRMEHALKHIRHQWKVEINNDPVQGVMDSANNVLADWIAVAPRHFAWFEDIFKRGITQKLAYTIDRPLLVLPSESMDNSNQNNTTKKTA